MNPSKVEPPFEIAPMVSQDWSEVCRIYLEGIASGNAAFETSAPSWESWDASHLKGCRLVARNAKGLLGWAALSPVSSRCVYAGVAEVSLYVGSGQRGRGVGSALLRKLVGSSEAAGIWTLEAQMFPENEASRRIHEKAGFEVVGVRRRLGRLNGRWRDVLMMERRSEVAGCE